MAVTNAFRNAVASGNVRSIRIMMKDSMLVDPTFTEFNEMERLARTVNGLYDTHDGRTLENDPSAWNDDYMNKLMVQVVGNFSQERINRLKEIVRHLRPVISHQQARASSSNIGNSSGVNGRGNSTYREPSSRLSQPSRTNYQYSKYQRPNYHQQKWLDSRNIRIRTTRVATGAVGGGLVVGTATAIAGGSFVAGAAVGAVVVGAAVFIATNRR